MADNSQDWGVLAEIGRYPEAIALCTSSVQDLENNCRAMEVLGYCHHQMGEPLEALKYFDRALELESQSFYVRLFRARSLERIGQYKSALTQDVATLDTWPALADHVAPHAIGLLPHLPADEDGTHLKGALSDRLNKPESKPEWRLRSLFLSGEDQKLRNLLQADEVSGLNFFLGYITSVFDYTRQHGGRIHYTGAAETIRIAPPHDIGEPATPPRRVQANTPYVAGLHDVQIVGGSSLVFGKPDTIISDTLADANFGQYVSTRADPCFVEKRVDAALVSFPKSTRLVAEGLYLSGLASDQFGHWFAEFLPKLRHFEKLPGYRNIPIIVDDGMPASHYDFLSLMSSNPQIRISRGETVLVGQLFVAPTTTFFPIELSVDHRVPTDNQASWSAEAFGFVRTHVLARLGHEGERKRMIYLSRRHSTWRRLINEEEIESTLVDMGFEVVLLENHDFREQVRIFQEAAFIVAPNGSALNSLVFADTGVKALVLAQKQQFNWGGWLGPMQDIGFDPRFLVGKAIGSADNKHADYLVSANAVRDAVLRIQGSGSAR